MNSSFRKKMYPIFSICHYNVGEFIAVCPRGVILNNMILPFILPVTLMESCYRVAANPDVYFFPLRDKEKKHEEQGSEKKKSNMLAFSLTSW